MHQWLALGWYSRAMQRMARNDMHIFWQILLECCALWCLDRRLTRDDSPDLGS
jgi:hypothetical protein